MARVDPRSRATPFPSQTLRPVVSADAFLLRTATVTNVNWSGERLTCRDVDESPRLCHYTEFHAERGDFGWVAQVGARAVGVVWCLHLPAEDPGFGFIAEGVPELSVCVLSGYRGLGVGSGLIHAALDEAARRGLARVSLSVEGDNPSVRLYRRCGFVPDESAVEGTMVVALPTPPDTGLPGG